MYDAYWFSLVNCWYNKIILGLLKVIPRPKYPFNETKFGTDYSHVFAIDYKMHLQNT